MLKEDFIQFLQPFNCVNLIFFANFSGRACVLWPDPICGWSRRCNFHHTHHVSSKAPDLSVCLFYAHTFSYTHSETLLVTEPLIYFSVCVFSCPVDRTITPSPSRPCIPRHLLRPPPPFTRPRPALSQTSLDL